MIFLESIVWEKLQKAEKINKLLQALAFQAGSQVSYSEIGAFTGRKLLVQGGCNTNVECKNVVVIGKFNAAVISFIAHIELRFTKPLCPCLRNNPESNRHVKGTLRTACGDADPAKGSVRSSKSKGAYAQFFGARD